MGFSNDRALQTNQLPISIDFSEDQIQFRQSMTDTYKDIANAMNSKEGALYYLQENANFQSWFKYSNPANYTPNVGGIRNGYRTTFDLVAMNFKEFGANTIPVGVTTLALSNTTTPPLINGILIPTSGFGAATIAGPIYIFINDPQLYVRFDNTIPGAQTLIITNNTGSVLTQAYFVIEYLKE